MRKQRVGILTSGGDAPGMNGAIRAVFRRVKGIDANHEIVLFREGLNGLAGRLEVNFDSNIERVRLRDILHRGGTFIGTGRVVELKDPPEDFPDVDAWMRRQREIIDTAVVNLRQLSLDAVVCIGGDGSFNGIARIAGHYEARYGEPIRVIGVPATIDNDIHGTQFSIGYDTATNNIIDALRKLRDTIDSHRRCAIVEVMGNSSGAIALSAGMAGGATAVLVPELPETWDEAQVLGRVRAAVRQDYRYIILVMAEGVRKACGNPRFAEDLAAAIAGDEQVSSYLGRALETRVNIIGYVARGGHPSAFDNMLAARLGVEAANAALDQSVDEPIMIGLWDGQVRRQPLAEVIAHSPRRLKADDEMVRTAEALWVRADQAF